MTEALKVLQIVGDSKYGGATYLILAWCRFLLDGGCDVTLLSTDSQTIAEAKEIAGIKIVTTILIPREVSFSKDLKALMQLKRLIGKDNYDIVHTHTSAPGFVGRMAAWLKKTPIRLHTAHGWPVTEELGWTAKLIFTPLEYLAGLVSTRIICVSHAVTHQGINLKIAPHQKIITICNGIAPKPYILAKQNELVTDVRRELGIAEECLLIGFAGRLAAQKDISTLIRSIEFLKALLPGKPFLLILAGEGPEMVNIENLSQTLGVSEHVRFLGFYTNIPGLLTAFDVFVNPSLWEGLSISIMEAMASSLPIVTTNILPNAELIEHEVTGLLVPPKSPEQLAEAIARFMHEPDLADRCAKAAHQRLLDLYTIDRMFQETWDLYIGLLEDNRSGKRTLGKMKLGG